MTLMAKIRCSRSASMSSTRVLRSTTPALLTSAVSAPRPDSSTERNRASDVVLDGDVGLHTPGRPALRADGVDRGGGAGFVAEPGEAHRPPVGGEQPGGDGADALAGPGHHGDAPVHERDRTNPPPHPSGRSVRFASGCS